MSISIPLTLENPQNPSAYSLLRSNLVKGAYNNKQWIVILRPTVTQTTYNHKM